MGLTIRLAGEAKKRGMIPRLPAPDRLVSDAQAWIATAYNDDTIRGTRCELLPSGETELLVEIHPAAEALSITVSESGHVIASADTSAAGPGYHTFVGHLLERLGDELEIGWMGESDTGSARPQRQRGWVPVRATAALIDRASVERAHMAWLGRSLARVVEARRQGATGLHLGLPAGRRYAFNGALATPLGPRDDAWLEQAVREPRVALDIRPWWLDATDARYLLHRALTILWSEVRWRTPADDGERAVVDEALRLLRRALPQGPSLPYPWTDWAELLALRDVDDPVRGLVEQRAKRVEGEHRPPIGYRRNPVTIIHQGWRLEVPGSFAERRTAEEWWGGERGRDVTIAAIATGSPEAPMQPDAFLARVAGDLGEGVLNHRDGDLAGKARIGTDTGSGVEVAVLEGFSAVTGRGAAIRIAFEEADDWRWAVDLWRSLRPA